MKEGSRGTLPMFMVDRYGGGGGGGGGGSLAH